MNVQSACALNTWYFERTNFPDCIGSLDGESCYIKCPSKAGSLFYSNEECHSLVLLAIPRTECTFVCTDVGTYGRERKSSVFSNSALKQSVCHKHSGQLIKIFRLWHSKL
jgi:hypothetical protein